MRKLAPRLILVTSVGRSLNCPLSPTPSCGDRPSHSPPAIPLNLNLAGALAWQHQEGHLHLGLIGLQREVGLDEQLGGGADALLLQALLEVVRKLKGSDCRWRRGRSCRDSVWGSNHAQPPKTKHEAGMRHTHTLGRGVHVSLWPGSGGRSQTWCQAPKGVQA